MTKLKGRKKNVTVAKIVDADQDLPQERNTECTEAEAIEGQDPDQEMTTGHTETTDNTRGRKGHLTGERSALQGDTPPLDGGTYPLGEYPHKGGNKPPLDGGSLPPKEHVHLSTDL